jgi:hypothetical protein
MSASLNDVIPTMMVIVIRGKVELDDLSYLPGGDLRPASRKPAVSPLSLPGVDTFAMNNDGVAAGEPPLPFTLAHRALLIMATDEIDFTTKMRILGQAFKLSSSETERHAGISHSPLLLTTQPLESL